MEVEKVEEGPLKSSEIARFLEASKTTYRAIDSILSEKKETSFQQRSLLDIASDSENRNKKVMGEALAQREEQVIISKEEEEEKQRQIQEAQEKKNREEEEALRTQEEQRLNEARLTEERKEKEMIEVIQINHSTDKLAPKFQKARGVTNLEKVYDCRI